MASTAKIEVRDNNQVAALQDFFKLLFEKEEISGLLVPCHMPVKGNVMPYLITDPQKLDKADPLAPLFPVNAAKIAAKITNGETEDMIAAVMRPCEIRAFIELVKLNQGRLENVLLIGFDCLGVFGREKYEEYLQDKDAFQATLDFLQALNRISEDEQEPVEHESLSRACKSCEYPLPVGADLNLGYIGEAMDRKILLQANTARGEGLLSRLGLPDSDVPERREKTIEEMKSKRKLYQEEMFSETAKQTDNLEKLSTYLSSCVNCYNCRVACPVCYCRECVFVTDVFDHKPFQYLGWAKQKGGLKLPTDTLFYHLTRLAHISTSCVGCGQCSNACPNDVPVMELFKMVASKTQKAFDYKPGEDPLEPLPLAVFQEEEFAEVTENE